MTNYERYKDEIGSILLETGSTPCVSVGVPVPCGDCSVCDFGELGIRCDDGFKDWLNEEYMEMPGDWSEVAVDTPILVSEYGKQWHRRHFALYESGKVYAWGAGKTSWSSDGGLTHWEYAKLADKEVEA